MLRTLTSLLAFVVFSSAATVLPAVVTAAPATVILAQGASLAETLTELQNATGGVLLSEPPVVERKLEHELKDASIADALREVGASFHLHPLQRRGTLLLVCRYADPREPLALELPEMALLAADISGLIRPFSPYSLDVAAIQAQRDFYGSLSTAQLDAMQGEGLPFRALKQEQQTLWLRINNTAGYASHALEAERLDRALRAWKRCGVVRGTNGRGTQVWWLAAPAPQEASGEEKYGLTRGQGEFQLRTAAPATETLPERRSEAPSSYQQPAPVVHARVRLADLIARVETATGTQITLPDYAKERGLLAYTGGATVRDVVMAVEDLYGWRLPNQSGRRYSLARPRPVPAQNALDLHRKLRAALPPCLMRLWSEEGKRALSHRGSLALDRVDREGQKLKGPQWEGARVADLAPETQLILARVFFEQRGKSALMDVVRRDLPFPWLLAPEQGVFRLKGERGPGKHPFLEFRAPYPDGKTLGWGWLIGTSSLDR